MLVLSRSRDQKIKIGDDITVMITDIRGDKVRVGIVAPPDVPIHREEVWQEIQKGKPLSQAIEASKVEQDAEPFDGLS